MRRKVCVVTASRADYSRVKTVLRELNRWSDVECQLVVAGAHLLERHGHTLEQIEADGFKAAGLARAYVPGDKPYHMALSVGSGVTDFARIYRELTPDVVLVLTDRYETLAAAVAASLMNIRVAHIQGGERTGTVDEHIRHAVTKLAHVHFPATETARAVIISMGEDSRYVYNVGCPATDLLFEAMREGHRNGSAPGAYVLVVQHPVTTEVDLAAEQMESTLQAVARVSLPVVLVLPNHDAGGRAMSDTIAAFLRAHSLSWTTRANLASHEFISWMRRASCMVGNSSAGIREACYFGVPVVNVGSRQYGRQRGSNVQDVDYGTEAICGAIQRQIAHGPYPPEYLYGDGTAGQQIAELLATMDLPPVQKHMARMLEGISA